MSENTNPKTAAYEAVWKMDDSQRAQAKALLTAIFTPEVLADPKAYKAEREALQLHGVNSRGLSLDSARTRVYRLLERADIVAPGKNAGANNGKAAETSAKETEANAIVAQGEAAIIKALTACITARPREISKARKILDAVQAADKGRR